MLKKYAIIIFVEKEKLYTKYKIKPSEMYVISVVLRIHPDKVEGHLDSMTYEQRRAFWFTVGMFLENDGQPKTEILNRIANL